MLPAGSSSRIIQCKKELCPNSPILRTPKHLPFTAIALLEHLELLEIMYEFVRVSCIIISRHYALLPVSDSISFI